MKYLYVMRHAKSSWKDHSLSDFQRPLNKRGRRTAPLVGALMNERGYEPDFILSSPAERAIETYRLVKQAGGFESEVFHQQGIYEASLNTLVTAVSVIDDKHTKVLMTGHNPGFEMLVQHLAGQYLRMPTAALAVFELAIDSWRNLSADSSNLVDYVVPKEVFEK